MPDHKHLDDRQPDAMPAQFLWPISVRARVGPEPPLGGQ
jgi:hypothetical protein